MVALSRVLALGLVVAVAAVGAAGAARVAAPSLTAAQVTKRFQAATGRKPAVDRRLTRPGHATALRLSSSVTNTALYGDFVLWVVGPASPEADVAALLADTHTGAAGTPAAAGIVWERGTSLSGTPYFLAKKRYGANLVLWRYGPVQKVDPGFSRLHKVLTRLVAG